MTQYEFIKYLESDFISFSIDNELIIITGGNVNLTSLITLPENVQFNNHGYVNLPSLRNLPENIEFNNGGNVYLTSLTTMSESVQFNNGGNVFLHSLTTMSENIQFNNGGNVYLWSLTTLPENIQFNNGGGVDLQSLTMLPKNIQFNNGGYVNLPSLRNLSENIEFNNGGNVILNESKKEINSSYLKRFKIEIDEEDYVTIYKRISSDYKTQENTKNETLWEIGTTIEHPAWNPEIEECGEGKFHACARPYWCDLFRSKKGDKYISIKVHKDDLYEWKTGDYPQKIAFRKGKVLSEVNRIDK